MSDDCKAAMLEAGMPYPCGLDCSCALKEENAALRAENERQREALKKAQWALQPFSDCVFNDNGDLTVESSARCSGHSVLVDAHFAYKAARAALETKGTGNETD